MTDTQRPRPADVQPAFYPEPTSRGRGRADAHLVHLPDRHVRLQGQEAGQLRLPRLHHAGASGSTSAAGGRAQLPPVAPTPTSGSWRSASRTACSRSTGRARSSRCAVKMRAAARRRGCSAHVLARGEASAASCSRQIARTLAAFHRERLHQPRDPGHQGPRRRALQLRGELPADREVHRARWSPTRRSTTSAPPPTCSWPAQGAAARPPRRGGPRRRRARRPAPRLDLRHRPGDASSTASSSTSASASSTWPRRWRSWPWTWSTPATPTSPATSWTRTWPPPATASCSTCSPSTRPTAPTCGPRSTPSRSTTRMIRRGRKAALADTARRYYELAARYAAEFNPQRLHRHLRPDRHRQEHPGAQARRRAAPSRWSPPTRSARSCSASTPTSATTTPSATACTPPRSPSGPTPPWWPAPSRCSCSATR